MTRRKAFPLADTFLAALCRPIGISRLSPAELESQLESLVSFMDDAFGGISLSAAELVVAAAERLPAVSELDLALALLSPSDLYLATVGAGSTTLERELLNARKRSD